jgi:uncharacterized membrane protein YedE/YeeE
MACVRHRAAFATLNRATCIFMATAFVTVLIMRHGSGVDGAEPRQRAAGLIFGVGFDLCMANPAKVQNFLDLAGSFDPSLIFVMGGAGRDVRRL